MKIEYVKWPYKLDSSSVPAALDDLCVSLVSQPAWLTAAEAKSYAYAFGNPLEPGRPATDVPLAEALGLYVDIAEALDGMERGRCVLDVPGCSLCNVTHAPARSAHAVCEDTGRACSDANCTAYDGPAYDGVVPRCIHCDRFISDDQVNCLRDTEDE